MRRLVWLAVIFGILWSAWWGFAAFGMKSALTDWFAERRAEGWQAEVSEIRTGGFPVSLTQTVVSPLLADPQTGLALEADALRFSAPVWWPGHLSVSLPQDRFSLASPLSRQEVETSQARADLRLRPGTALELERMSVISDDWSVTAPEGGLLAAQSLTLAMTQGEDDRDRYAFTLDAPAFALGALTRDRLRIPDDWPAQFDSLAIDAVIDFDRPFDLTAIEDARPQPRRIALSRAEAIWGRLLIRSAADLNVAEDGVLSGEVSLQVRNWREILRLAEAAGTLPAALRPQVEGVLGMLAGGSGNSETLDVTLTLRDGRTFLGFLPIGPAPRLVLR